MQALKALGLAVLALVGLAVFQLLSASRAHADELSWVGGHGTNWSEARNWSPEKVPEQDDVVSIQQTPSGPATVENIPYDTVLKGVALGRGGSVSGGSLTLSESFRWTGGTMRTGVTVAAAGVASINGDDPTDRPRFYYHGKLTLHGTTDWSGGLFAYPDPGFRGVLTNTGQMRAQGGTVFTAGSCCGDPMRFTNYGTFSVVGSGTVTFDGVALVNKAGGRIDVADPTGSFDLRIAPSRLEGGSVLTGSGNLRVADRASLTLSGHLTLPLAFRLDGGQLLGRATLKGTGQFIWAGGTIAGSLTVAPSVRTVIVQIPDLPPKRVLRSADAATESGILNLEGPTLLSQSSQVSLSYGAVINNIGTLTARQGAVIAADSCCRTYPQFVNRGVFVVNERVAAAGAVPPAPVQVKNMTFANAGRVNLARGGSVLDVSSGTFDQTRYGTLSVTIEGTTAGNGYSQVKARTAKVDGGLVVRTTSTFHPAAGNTFRVLSAGSGRTGTFASVTGLTLGDGRTYTLAYPTAGVDSS